ncbi:MAG: hypothetical protein WBX25_12590 [Rhodomicrobium sp.]
MPLTSAEKQRAYRARHLGVDGTKVRLQLLISLECEAQIKLLAAHHGYSITRMVEVLAAEAENALLDKLPPGEQQAYYHGCDSWKPAAARAT